MKSSLLIAALLLLSSFSVPAQKTNAQLSSQNRNAKIKMTYEGDSTKLMGVGENFTDAEAKAAKVMAMNFAVGFFYPGQTLERAPEQVLLTFWVMSKKPVFAEKHSLTFYVAGDEIIIGAGRYGAKARENMEYLNYYISRDVLMKVASNSNVQFKLGDSIFAFSRDHMRMIADLMVLSDPMAN